MSLFDFLRNRRVRRDTCKSNVKPANLDRAVSEQAVGNGNVARHFAQDLLNVTICQQVLLATNHCKELAGLVRGMRDEALGQSCRPEHVLSASAERGNVALRITTARLNVLCTVEHHESCVRFHYSVSMPSLMPGFYLTGPQGQTLALFIGRVLGIPFRQMRVSRSVAHVFHVEWDVPVGAHANWLGNPPDGIDDATTIDQLRDECFGARQHMNWGIGTVSPDSPSRESPSDVKDAESSWYFATSSGDRKGPMSFEALLHHVRSGVVGPATYVWRPGLNSWVVAGSVCGLLPQGDAGSAVSSSGNETNQDTTDITRGCDLWKSLDEAGLTGPETLSFNAFLGAQYALMAAAQRCVLTPKGRGVVRQAILEMQEAHDAEGSEP